MKRLWVILFVLPLFAQNEYDITHLIKKNGIYIKKFSDEKVNGEVFRMFGDMKAPLGKMKDGKQEGKWVDWYENGQKESEQTFKNGKEQGLAIRWYENGQKNIVLTVKDGELNGLFTFWYENGQKEYEETYKNGKKNGLSTTWYENGSKKSERKYKDDLITSEVEWSEDGKLSSEKTEDGEKTFKTTYYTTGTKEMSVNLVSGKREGLQIIYYKNGNKKTESNYVNDLTNGEYKVWYSNGLLKSVSNYKDDLLEGEYIDYYDNGSKKSERKYKDGRRVSIIDFKRKDN
jgi:antitoxin component YwqK of YwqJK toxin-antitoxin module